MWSFTLLFVSSSFITVISFTSDVIQRRRPSDHAVAMLIDDENRNKFRFITPGDINKLFGPNSPGSAGKSGDKNDSEDYDEDEGEESDIDDDDDDEDEISNKEINIISQSASTPSPVVMAATPAVSYVKSEEDLEQERNFRFYSELAEMETGYMEGKLPAFMQAGTPVIEKKKQLVKKKRGMQADYDYLELDRVINQDEFRQIRSTLSLSEAPGLIDAPARVTKYDPAGDNPYQRMNYGLYRRANGLDNKGQRIKPGGKKLKQVRSSNKGDKKESFYDSIRNLGEGARAEAGTAQGVLDPPPRKPKKNVNALPGKGKKAIITPGDIENLFRPNKNKEKLESELTSLAEDPDNKNPMNAALRAELMDFKSGRNNGASERDSNNKGTPDWLREAEQEIKNARLTPSQRRKKENKKGSKRLKALTNDWRFWAATIASVGFITAFINVYQTTGGFVGSGQGPELII